MIDFNDPRQVAKAIQYTNVNPDLTRAGLLAHVATCAEFGFDAAMVAPCFVALAREALTGTGVKVASTVNFPMANDTLGMKLAVVGLLAKEGADARISRRYRCAGLHDVFLGVGAPGPWGILQTRGFLRAPGFLYRPDPDRSGSPVERHRGSS